MIGVGVVMSRHMHLEIIDIVLMLGRYCRFGEVGQLNPVYLYDGVGDDSFPALFREVPREEPKQDVVEGNADEEDAAMVDHIVADEVDVPYEMNQWKTNGDN